jgi:hypothetical protein
MNQFFSFKRFSLLVLKHWADNKKRYGLSVLAFMGVLVAWFVMLGSDLDHPLGDGEQRGTFFFSLFAAGTFFASQYFRDLGSRAKASNFLLVPASAFEKLLCGLLYSVLLFFVVFTAAFYLVDLLMVSVSNMLVARDEAAGEASLVNVFNATILQFRGGSKIWFLLLFFPVQAAFFLGSIYFEKYSFIKTIIAGFVLCVALFWLMYFLHRQFLHAGGDPDGFLASYGVHLDGINGRSDEAPRWIGQVYSFLLMYATAPFLWIVTYFRLKEKQV